MISVTEELNFKFGLSYLILLIFEKFVFNGMCTRLHVCNYAWLSAGACSIQKRVLDTLELELLWL